MNIAAAVAEKLLQIKAIKLSPQKPFTWASGLHSPIYCDNRTVLSHPPIRAFIVDALVEKSREFQSFDLIAGVATAGIPHGVLLADRLQLPFVYVRDKPKAHGRQNVIEGEVHPGKKVLVVEDLISTGGSSLKVVEALQEAGAEVVGVLAIFSYGFPQAHRAFEAINCPLTTLSDYAALLEEAVRQQCIAPEDFQLLQTWREDPQAWSKRWE